MSNIVDFNKAKKAAEDKKTAETNLKDKNNRLAQKRKRYDSSKKFKLYHYYIAIMVLCIVFVLVQNMIK